MRVFQQLNGSVRVFKAAQVFIPSKVAEEKTTSATVDLLKSFPFLNNVIILDALKAELSIRRVHTEFASNAHWNSLRINRFCQCESSRKSRPHSQTRMCIGQQNCAHTVTCFYIL